MGGGRSEKTKLGKPCRGRHRSTHIGRKPQVGKPRSGGACGGGTRGIERLQEEGAGGGCGSSHTPRTIDERKIHLATGGLVARPGPVDRWPRIQKLVTSPQPLLPHIREEMYMACRLCSTRKEREKHQHVNSIFSLPHMLNYLFSLQHYARPTESILNLPFP